MWKESEQQRGSALQRKEEWGTCTKAYARLKKKEKRYSIGCRIRHFHRKAKMTQPQLASLVDIDGRTLSFYENGSREMGVNRLFR